jgi:aldose 1-epimerase
VEATICGRAAALRSLSVEGIDIVEPTLNIEPPPGLAGATMFPWPNRVEGALWSLHGVEQELEVTESEFGHANHGLLLNTVFEVVAEDQNRLEMSATVSERPGFPFTLKVNVSYSVEASGVRVGYSVRNLSDQVAPFAIGAHPYLSVGEELVENLFLEIGATRALALDETNIPRGEIDVTGSCWDLRGARDVPSVKTNATYTGLAIEQGLIVHRLRSPKGKSVELWADPDFAWVQVYIAHEFEGDRGTRTAIAVEPMTAPPNALRTGEGLRWLEPGESWEAEWGIRLAFTSD